MRHLFLVPSHVNTLAARGIVDREKLVPGDVALLCARGYRPPEERFRIADLVLCQCAPQGNVRQKKLTKGRRWLRALDHLIETTTSGVPFHFYTAHTYHRYMNVIARHTLCEGFSLIEERLASYFNCTEIDAAYPPITSRWRRHTTHGKRVANREFYAPGHAKAYGLSASSFPDLEGRVVLGNVFSGFPAGPIASAKKLRWRALHTRRRGFPLSSTSARSGSTLPSRDAERAHSRATCSTRNHSFAAFWIPSPAPTMSTWNF